MKSERERIQIVIITGMSGAGKTVAAQSLEDLGFFVVDNLPPTLIPKFVELIDNANGRMNKIALVIDLRGRRFFDQLFEAIDQLEQSPDLQLKILFLEANDATTKKR